jgi:predicted nucleic acid-binding protein
VIVADASVLADALYDSTDRGERARNALTGRPIHVPDLIYAEIGNVLRRRLQSAKQPTVDIAVLALTSAPWTVHAIAPLVARALDFRANTTAYDAIYLALAERLACPFLTGDAKLINGAQGQTCQMILHR